MRITDMIEAVGELRELPRAVDRAVEIRQAVEDLKEAAAALAARIEALQGLLKAFGGKHD